MENIKYMISQENKFKLTDEELQELKQTYESYQKCIFDLGLINYDIEIAKEQLANLDKEKSTLMQNLKNIITKQQEVSDNLSKKYGDKQVDLETGYLN